MKIFHFALVCTLLNAPFAIAQTTSRPDTQDPAASQSATTQAPEEAPASGQATGQPAATGKDDKDKSKDDSTSKDRLFYALPNFLTLEQKGGQIAPLTAGQKFKVVARGSFDPIQIVWYGALSGISQAENSEPGYGQGWAAYGKRFGAYAADGTIENFFVGAILPSMLHQDPRFFQSGQGSFFHRTGYAMSRIVVTRTDSGHSQFNYSEIFGSAMASAISTYSYHPRRTFRGFVEQNQTLVPVYWPSDRTLKNTASVWGSQVGYDTITLVIKEFWPDLRRKIKKQPH